MDNSKSRQTWRTILDLGSTVLSVLTCLVVLGFVARDQFGSAPNPQREEAPLPTAPISLAGVPAKGHPQARVVVLEFSDFQCPFCSKFVSDTLPEIEKKYVQPGQVRMAFRHLPLSIHQNAVPAA